MKLSYKQKLLVIIFSCLDLFILESIIKYFLLNKIPAQGFYFTWLQIAFYKNTNIAFGLPLPQVLTIVLVIVILIILSFIWWQSLIRKNLWQIFAISLIILGALSNLLDRLIFGYVIDYLNIFIWPIFNLADCLIVIGLIIFLVSEFKLKTKTKEVSNENKNC